MEMPIVLVLPPDAELLRGSPRRKSPVSSLGSDLPNDSHNVIDQQKVVRLDQTHADVNSMALDTSEAVVLKSVPEEDESLFNVRNNHVRGILEVSELPLSSKWDWSFVACVLQVLGQLPDAETDFPRFADSDCCSEFLSLFKMLHGEAEDGVKKPDPSRFIQVILDRFPTLFQAYLPDPIRDRLAKAEFSPPLSLLRLLLNDVLSKTRFRSRFRSSLVTRSTCLQHGSNTVAHETRWFALPPELAAGDVSITKHLDRIVASVCTPCCESAKVDVEFLSLPRFLVIFITRNADLNEFLRDNPFAAEVSFRISPELDMSHFVPGAKESLNVVTLYKLHGFITQTGSMSTPRLISLPRTNAAGPLHYICYTRCQGNRQFYRCDEELVAEVDLGIGEIKTSGAQALIYHLQDHRVGGAAKFVSKPKPKTEYTETKVIGRGINSFWS